MKKLTAIITVCAICCICCPLLLFAASYPAPLAAASGNSGAQGNGTANQPLKLTEVQALQLADMLAEQGKFEEAIGLYVTLLESKKAPLRVEALFKLGGVYTGMREYGKAIEVYLAILNHFPDLVRVRLELARVYFLDKDFDKADFHFRLAQGAKDLPPEVNEKINVFLEAIRKQKNWSLSGSFNIVPDSNLNSASGAQRECINTVFGMLCRDLEDEQTGVGFKVSAAADHYLRINRNFGLKSSASAYVLDFPNRRFDDHSLRLASGPRLMFSRGEVSLQPVFKRRWAAGKSYELSYGATLDTSVDIIDRLSLDTGVSYLRNTYDDKVADSVLRGNTFDVYAELRYILNAKSFVGLGADYSNDNTTHKSYASQSYSYNISYFNELPLGITAYARLSLMRTAYKESRWFITSDGYIEDIKRRDKTLQGYLRLSNRRWEYLGFTPTLNYTYTHRTSNAWNYGYDRHKVELGLRQSF